MRFNIDALTCLLATNQAPDWEGGLCYKPPLSSGLLALQPVFRERYFKLIGNLLYFAKGVNWRVEDQIVLKILELKENKPVKVKRMAFHNFDVQMGTFQYSWMLRGILWVLRGMCGYF